MVEIGLNGGLNKGLFRKKPGGTKVGNFLRKNVNLRNTIKATSLVASFVPVVGGVASKGLNLLSKLGAVGRLGIKAVALANTPMGKMVMEKAKAGINLSPAENQMATNIVVANETDPNTPNVLTPAQFNAIAPNQVQASAPLYQPAQPAMQPQYAPQVPYVAPQEQQAPQAPYVAPQEQQAPQAPYVARQQQQAPQAPYVAPQEPQYAQDEPQGDVVPVKLANKEATPIATPLATETKNNTMLYVGGGVVLLGLVYALTHKKQ